MLELPLFEVMLGFAKQGVHICGEQSWGENQEVSFRRGKLENCEAPWGEEAAGCDSGVQGRDPGWKLRQAMADT